MNSNKVNDDNLVYIEYALKKRDQCERAYTLYACTHAHKYDD